MPEELRGTYRGLASEPSIRHLKELGVTAVELMPVHHHADEWHLVQRGLGNYWGYNTLAYFAPDCRYAAAQLAARRGARVQDDGARAARGRSRSDPRRRLQPHRGRQPPRPDALAARHRQLVATTGCCRDHPRYYQDFTGCGNTLNMRSPRVLQLIMDSLRYWVLRDARRRIPLRSRERTGS